MDIRASLQCDEDGFLSRECPTCLGRFKAPIKDGTVIGRFCPYCGHEGEGCWWTPQQLDYMRALALGAIKPQLDAAFEGLERSGGLISISVERSSPEPAVVPVEPPGSEVRQQCEQCLAELKLETARLRTVTDATAPFTCIECGNPQEVVEGT